MRTLTRLIPLALLLTAACSQAPTAPSAAHAVTGTWTGMTGSPAMYQAVCTQVTVTLSADETGAVVGAVAYTPAPSIVGIDCGQYTLPTSGAVTGTIHGDALTFSTGGEQFTGTIDPGGRVWTGTMASTIRAATVETLQSAPSTYALTLRHTTF